MKTLWIMVIISGYNVITPVYGQHNNVWFRNTLNAPLTEKITVDLEIQHRRQSGFGNDDVFNKNLMNTFRTWVNHQLNHDVKLSVSPLACFTNYKIIQNYIDQEAVPTREFRYAAAIDLQHELLKKLFVVDRTSTEFRTFSGTQRNITRLRSRIGLRYDINDKVKLGVFDEHLLNIKGVTHDHFLDHARLGFNIEYKTFKKLKLDVGYIHIKRLPLNSNQKLFENNVYLNFTYKLLDKPIFAHKEQKHHS